MLRSSRWDRAGRRPRREQEEQDVQQSDAVCEYRCFQFPMWPPNSNSPVLYSGESAAYSASPRPRSADRTRGIVGDVDVVEFVLVYL